MPGLVQVENYRARPLHTPSYTVTPYVQAVRVGLNGWPFLYLWRRPVSVLVQDRAGQEVVLPVRDATRIAVVVMAGIILGAAISSFLLSRARRPD
jgi:hypothetical protein